MSGALRRAAPHGDTAAGGGSSPRHFLDLRDFDGATLRIEDPGLGRDIDGEAVAAHRAMTSSWR